MVLDLFQNFSVMFTNFVSGKDYIFMAMRKHNNVRKKELPSKM